MKSITLPPDKYLDDRMYVRHMCWDFTKLKYFSEDHSD